jgi:hypothetical protein
MASAKYSNMQEFNAILDQACYPAQIVREIDQAMEAAPVLNSFQGTVIIPDENRPQGLIIKDKDGNVEVDLSHWGAEVKGRYSDPIAVEQAFSQVISDPVRGMCKFRPGPQPTS